MEHKRYVCIVCPNSCEIEVECEGGTIKRISGNVCPRGEEYARKEHTCPERGMTSTLRVESGKEPLVSVKLSKTIPKEKIEEVLESIRDVKVCAPVKIGDVIAKNVLGTGADLVATKKIDAKN